jgi:hypothetical protein
MEEEALLLLLMTKATALIAAAALYRQQKHQPTHERQPPSTRVPVRAHGSRSQRGIPFLQRKYKQATLTVEM